VAITYFNWSEIWLLSRRDLAAIICLAYGQTMEYDELSAKTMMKTLKLDHIPPELFRYKLFTQHKHILSCDYVTRDVQNYFNNSSFLYTNTSAKHKAVYIKALGLRKISCTDNYIPLRYFPNVTYNPFLTVENEKIYFPLESSL
jgi:hypothetical protein